MGFDFAGSFKQDTYTISYHKYQLELTKAKVRLREKRRAEVSSNQIHIKITSGDLHDAIEAGLMFLSEISWLWDVEIFGTEMGGGNGPIRFHTRYRGSRFGGEVVDITFYRPMPLNDIQRLAVGLYKEGISSNSIFFKYLGLYKILEIEMTGKQREKWLTEYLTGHWPGFNFDKKHEYVPKDPDDLQRFLYKYGRCAVAHGKDDLTVDAHSLNDFRTIGVCYDVIKDAVRHYMKAEMGIPKLLQY